MCTLGDSTEKSSWTKKTESLQEDSPISSRERASRARSNLFFT